ncbi:putative DNA-binding protein [Ruegeria sp. TM1040]|uniref:ParB/RepB/Spo0J family partition protein n=1 Tax=Ruegeria sp. (strain TM1040) TaxID=292414 RepID=UPI0000462382|nr:ParB/RepB/Spo0J family partition protein [Ruegeria sp. TM1040]ABF64375.1 putative DNA-binding protein [Ruegeria sp. TM1040]
MTKHSPLNHPDAPLQYLPLSELYLHDMNPRQDTPDDDVAAMADSITVNGLLQNLLGYRDPANSGVGIVAGGRRLRGLIHLGKNGAQMLDSKAPDLSAIPVQVTDDAFLARAWAGTESATQKPLHPADEIRAYAALADQGNSAEMIARTFAQTVRHVKGRLALAHLCTATIEALRRGDITLDVAKALTLARDPEQELEVLQGALDGKRQEWWVKQQLTDSKVRASNYKAAYVGRDGYVAAGGRMRDDLFDDESYLEDPDILDALFEKKLADIAEGIKVQFGWNWVKPHSESHIPYSLTSNLTQVAGKKTPLSMKEQNEQAELQDKEFRETLTPAEAKRLNELESKAKPFWEEATRAKCGIYVYVDHRGKLCIDGAYKDQKSTKKNTRPGDAGAETDIPSPKLTQAGVEDLRRIQLLALQTATLGKTELVLDLFAWQLECGYATYSGLFNISLTDPQIEPEAEGAWTVDDALSDGSNQRELGRTQGNYAESFKTFQAKGKKHRNTVLTRHLIRTINGQTVNALGTSLLAPMVEPDIRSVWTPDAPTYFSRISKAALESLWQDLVLEGRPEADAADFNAMRKSDKIENLHRLFNDADFRKALQLGPEAEHRIATWLPPEMETEAAQ